MHRNDAPPAPRPGAREDAELIRIVQSLPVGDRQREAAFEELVRRYQPLVSSCAMRYLHSPEPQEELIQAGYVGLLSAINNFDPSLGSSLLAYARPCISGEIKRHFRDKRWQVRVRRAAQELRAEVLRCEADLTQELCRTPTEAEVAERLQLSEEEVDEARRADRAFHALSLDAPFSADPEAATLGEVLRDDDSDDLDRSLGIDAVWTHMPELPEREQYILSLRFFGNMTQTQIGECLGISQMHVSRLLAHALRFLKQRILSAEGDSQAGGKPPPAGQAAARGLNARGLSVPGVIGRSGIDHRSVVGVVGEDDATKLHSLRTVTPSARSRSRTC